MAELEKVFDNVLTYAHLSKQPLKARLLRIQTTRIRLYFPDGCAQKPHANRSGQDTALNQIELFFNVFSAAAFSDDGQPLIRSAIIHVNRKNCARKYSNSTHSRWCNVLMSQWTYCCVLSFSVCILFNLRSVNYSEMLHTAFSYFSVRMYIQSFYCVKFGISGMHIKKLQNSIWLERRSEKQCWK